MSDIAPIDQPAASHQKRSAVGKARPGTVSGKLKTAIDAMAYDGADYQAAAQKAGLTTRAVRLALDRPHVKAYYEAQMQVLLTSERARNLHRAVKIRDQEVNQTAALNAAKWLHDPHDRSSIAASSRAVTPGVVVQVNVHAGARQVDETVIEVGPAASQAADDGAGNG